MIVSFSRCVVELKDRNEDVQCQCEAGSVSWARIGRIWHTLCSFYMLALKGHNARHQQNLRKGHRCYFSDRYCRIRMIYYSETWEPLFYCKAIKSVSLCVKKNIGAFVYLKQQFEILYLFKIKMDHTPPQFGAKVDFYC